MAIKGVKRKVIIENEEDSDENPSKDSSSEVEMQESDSNIELESEDEAINVENEENTTTNLGWADSIAKILKTNKPKGKKSLVLSKAKKLTDPHKPKDVSAGFEVETTDGQIKEEQVQKSQSSEDESKSKEPHRKKKKEIASFRVKPDILQKDRERTLTKIATKGVVQLFNAVKKQQKDIDTKLSKAGPLEVKRDKVLKNIDKREFLNVLMGDKSKTIEKSERIENPTKNKATKNESTWNVLRDDFMMGGKMKDWDKEEEEEEIVQEETMESE